MEDNKNIVYGIDNIPGPFDITLQNKLYKDCKDSIIFFIKNEEIIKLANDGNIYIKGELVENNKDVVEAFKKFLASQGFYSTNWHSGKFGDGTWVPGTWNNTNIQDLNSLSDHQKQKLIDDLNKELENKRKPR